MVSTNLYQSVEADEPTFGLCKANITFDDATVLMEREARPLGTEAVPVQRAGRRILAEPVLAAIDAPPYRAAAMDGFAVHDAEFRSAAACASIIGSSYPTAPWRASVGPGEAVRIMTGAEVPPECDRVLPIELVDERESSLWLRGPLPDRHHIREQGSDIRTGDMVLPAGAILDPRRMLVACGADARTVTAWRQPVVRAIASGDELVAPGDARDGDGRIPDSLSESLLLLARQWGAKPIGGARVPDDLNKISEAALEAIDADVLIMIGGASRGDRDFARPALASLGLQMVFESVLMKPGKPVWYGKIGQCHIVGLPGNPTAAFTIARLFLVPLLCALGGRGFASGLDWQPRLLARACPADAGRESFLCARTIEGSVEILERQVASAQKMLAEADCLVRMVAGGAALPHGALVNTLKL